MMKSTTKPTSLLVIAILVTIQLAHAAPIKVQIPSLPEYMTSYDAAAIATELNSILAADAAYAGSSVTVDSLGGDSLMNSYYHPYYNTNTKPVYAKIADYMVILPEYGTLVSKPEIAFEGVLQASQRALEIGKKPLLLMPALSSPSSAWDTHVSNTYRIARGCGITPVPAGVAVKDKGLSYPSTSTDQKRQAYLVAAMIYSAISGKNAASTGYAPVSNHADLANSAHSTLNTQNASVHYTTSSAESGTFRIRRLDPLPEGDNVRIIYCGSSTENGIRRGLSPSLRGNGYKPSLNLIEWYQAFDQNMFDKAKPSFDARPNQYLALYARSTSIHAQTVKDYKQSNIMCFGYDRHTDGQLQWDDIHRNVSGKTSGLYSNFNSMGWHGIPIHLAAVRLHAEAPWIPYGRDGTHMHEAMDFAVAAMMTTSMMGHELDPEKLPGPGEIQSKEWAAGPDEKIGYAVGIKVMKQIAFMAETGRFVPDRSLAINTNMAPAQRFNAYQHQFTASGGNAPYTWSIVSKQGLPEGLSLSPGGLLSGTCIAPVGVFRTVLMVEDSNGAIMKTPLSIKIEGLDIELRNPDNPTNVISGLKWTRFHGNWSQLPDFNTLTADAEGSCDRVRLGLGEPDNLYAYRYSGFISVPTSGLYTFHTRSDDGSRLYIGSTLVVDNDGVHGPEEQSGDIGLKAGLHAFTVTFFEQSGGNVIEAYWSGPGLSKQQIPATSFDRQLSASYAAWAGGNFSHSFTSIDPYGNGDGDRMGNMMEFAFGTDPTIADGGSLAMDGSANGAPVTARSPGGVMELYYVRRKDHGTSGSMRYSAQFSADLHSFTDSISVPAFVANSTDHSDYEVVKVPFPADAKFGRIAVEFAE